MIRVVEAITDTNIGGAGRLLLNRIKNSTNPEVEYIVILPRGSALVSLLKSSNIRFYEIDGGYNRSFAIKDIFVFYNAVCFLRPQILNSHGALSARIAGRLARVPVNIYTRHCDFPTSKIFKCKMVRFFVRLLSRLLSDGIIAVSFSAEDNLLRLGIDKKYIKVIVNGVEKVRMLSSNERNLFKSTLGIEASKRVISIFARLEAYKDHDTFLKAAQCILQRNNYCFLVVGAGSEEGRLKALANELNISDCVLFIGFVEDVAPYMNITDINVNCSIGTETSSLALSEGMSIGIPAIASDYLGNTYMIREGENGMIFPQGDYGVLAEKIEQLLSDNKLYNMLSKGAKKRFNNELNAKFTAEVTEKYYFDCFMKKQKNTA